jgi:UDP-GlcNAc:undecaprenyl-phosphate GlcNAc-1-phosphate transferase
LPILVLGIFIFDMTYITIARILNGRVKTFKEWIEYTGKDHIHHRLVSLGFTEIQTVLFIYLIALSLGLGAINLRATSDLKVYSELLQGLCILTIIVILMLAGRELDNK